MHQQKAKSYKIKLSSFLKCLGRFIARQFVFVFLFTTKILPMKFNYALANMLGFILFHTYFRLRRTALNNLEAALGEQYSKKELTQIAIRIFRNLCMNVFEFLNMRQMSVEDLHKKVQLEGTEHLDEALKKGNGVIVLTGHFGNWELMAAKLTVSGYPLSVIAKDQRDSAITHLINETRGKFGTQVISRGDTRKMVSCLKNNEALGILPDQNETGGVIIDFFGRPAATATGPVVFALRMKALVVPGFIERDENNNHTVRMQPALDLIDTGDREKDILENTKLFTRVIEKQISQRPDHWMWIHRRWKCDEKKPKD